MKQNNLISIIIPCYNQGSFLKETLDSVLDQSYANWECIIINDGSIDNTEEIALQYTIKDTRFKYFSKVNSGVGDSRNLGLQKVKGCFIQFLDSDDLLAADKLFISINMIKNYKVDIVCSNYKMFSKSLDFVAPPFSQLDDFDFNFYNLARYWNDGFTIPIHCWFFKSSLFKNIEFPKSLTAQEDWAVWLRIFQEAPKTFYTSTPLAFYRRNPLGRTQNAGFFEETLRAIYYLKAFLNEADFKVLYESTIIRYNSGMLYWKNREIALKKSNTYHSGLMFKKIMKKIGLLPIAKTIFIYTKSLN